MKIQSWKDKKNHLCGLIKSASDYHGGDDIVWLREYCREIIEKYTDNLDEIITCFETLVECQSTKAVTHDTRRVIPLKIGHTCGYVPPFCLC